MPEKKILFVDDEANVLQGLRRMLRPMRRDWDMSFSLGAQEALETLSDGSFDVIVSDMRMPGMDGAALLTEVMRQYPRMVRIVLSGQSSQEATMRSVGVAHQFLAKPCDAETLKRTIDQAFALRELLADEPLKQTLSQLKSVPSLPALYDELMEELREPDASTKRVGNIISRDPGMTAKILQMVNSAFFGLPRHVSTPSQAAALLGVETIKTLVLSIDVFSQFGQAKIEGITPESVQRHSADTAIVAKQIAAAEKAPREVTEGALMAGFLHDVGKLILAHNFPDQYREIMTRARENKITIRQAEHDVLGASHAEVGAYLLGLWGLPEPMVEATAFHHNPNASCGTAFSPLTAVHVADVLAREQAGNDRAAEELDLDYLNQIGLADRVPVWRTQCKVGSDNGGGDA